MESPTPRDKDYWTKLLGDDAELTDDEVIALFDVILNEFHLEEIIKRLIVSNGCVETVFDVTCDVVKNCVRKKLSKLASIEALLQK